MSISHNVDPSTSDPCIRLERARCSLEGLSVGDSLGDRWFFTRAANTPSFQPIQDRTLPPRPWEFTDDTQMALSIIDVLCSYQGIDQDKLALSFAVHFDRMRGYGMAMYDLLPQFLHGNLWHTASRQLFNGQGSYGNGAAMRVAPLGAYFADDMDVLIDHARRSAEVTHSHPEAIAGAIAIAAAAAVAWRARNEHSHLNHVEFIDRILPFVPVSEVRTKIEQAISLNPDTSIWEVVSVLGNGSSVAAQDTIAFTLWCAGQSLDNYEEAIWLTLSGGGDYDTNCAIVGGIVVMFTGVDGIPAKWRENREPLPDWPFRG